MSMMDRELLMRLYRSALDAADPARALQVALDGDAVQATDRTWIIALGKAAHPLAASAVEWLQSRGHEPAGGIVVAPDAADPPHPGLVVTTGDHPLPGEASHQAAEALENTVRQVLPGDDVWVLLSGGTTSLIASPVRGLSMDELRDIYRQLLGSGLDITAMNRVRKRISRWGAGRLAVALAHAPVRVYLVSDVIGDDIASIASGPCSPDPTTAVTVRAILDEAGLLQRVPKSLIDLLDRTERRMVPETPKPGEAAFRDLKARVIASNRVALTAVAAEAERAGMTVRVRRRPLSGEAARCGAAVALRMIEDGLHEPADADEEGAAARPACYIGGGETTVTLDGETGQGGRCQELALAAARVLDGRSDVAITLLAAGTDGRDGPTDAAGAIVDNATWRRIVEAGHDPLDHLTRHDAYAALDAAGALLRVGPTGTNVLDIVAAIVRPVEAGVPLRPL